MADVSSETVLKLALIFRTVRPQTAHTSLSSLYEDLSVRLLAWSICLLRNRATSIPKM